MLVKIIPNTNGAPAGKLAEAEVCFADGLLAGLKLVGFGVWEGRNSSGRNVAFPSRSYQVNGERRHYVLLRAVDDLATLDPLRERILRAYADYENGAGAVTVSS